jgi:hypothetical protein
MKILFIFCLFYLKKRGVFCKHLLKLCNLFNEHLSVVEALEHLFLCRRL